MNVEQRIESYSAPDPNSGCFLWLGSVNGGGYARMSINSKLTLIHRYVLEEKLGRKLLPKEHALHSCDVPSCINPDHLHAGSHKQNMKEMWERNPPKLVGQRGERSPHAKLLESDVLVIRASADSERVLAKRFGVSHQTIYRVKRRMRWRHI